MIGHTTCIWKAARGPILRVWVHFEPQSERKSLIAISSILVQPYSIDIPIGAT